MKRIMLTKGAVALVDDEDYSSLNRYKWYTSARGYAVRDFRKGGRRIAIYMHRYILDSQKGQEVDHINRDTLDNRRDNLRFCTKSQNNANAKKRVGCSSQYKGVSFHKNTGKWRVQIWNNKIRYSLGYFMDETIAGRTYNQKARELFGEFARLNNV